MAKHRSFSGKERKWKNRRKREGEREGGGREGEKKRAFLRVCNHLGSALLLGCVSSPGVRAMVEGESHGPR